MRGSARSRNQRSMSWVTAGAPWSAAEASPTTMKGAPALTSSLRKAISLLVKIRSSATEKGPSETFERLALQKEERMPHILARRPAVSLHDAIELLEQRASSLRRFGLALEQLRWRYLQCV